MGRYASQTHLLSVLSLTVSFCRAGWSCVSVYLIQSVFSFPFAEAVNLGDWIRIRKVAKGLYYLGGLLSLLILPRRPVKSVLRTETSSIAWSSTAVDISKLRFETCSNEECANGALKVHHSQNWLGYLGFESRRRRVSRKNVLVSDPTLGPPFFR